MRKYFCGFIVLMMTTYAICSYGLDLKQFLFFVGMGMLLMVNILKKNEKNTFSYTIVLLAISGIIQYGLGEVNSWIISVALILTIYWIVSFIMSKRIEWMYQNKVCKVIWIVIVPVLLIATHFSETVGSTGVHLYVPFPVPILTYPLIFMILPFSTASILEKNSRWNFSKSVTSLPVNQVFLLIYVILIVILCGWNDDYGIVSVAAAMTVCFMFYARNWQSKFGVIAVVLISFFILTKISDKIYVRWLIFWNLKRAAEGSDFAKSEAAFFQFLFRMMKQSGLFGTGIGSTTYVSKYTYKTMTTDYVFSLLLIECGLLLAIALIVTVFLLIKELLFAPTENMFAYLLNLSIAVTFAVTFSVNILSSVSMFPPLGIPLPLISQGNSIYIMAGVMFAIHDGLKRRRKSL